MSKCTEIRDFLGDYAFDVEYSENNQFTMFFNSRRNAETVKRCIEVDDSVPNAATAVDFVEVVRCKNCKYANFGDCYSNYYCKRFQFRCSGLDYCSYGMKENKKVV